MENRRVGLKLMQWNAQSVMAHGLEFKQFINNLTDKPDIICLQETFLKNKLKFVIQGYDIYVEKMVKMAEEGWQFV